MVGFAGAIALSCLPGADVADRRDGLAGHPQAVAHVVYVSVALRIRDRQGKWEAEF